MAMAPAGVNVPLLAPRKIETLLAPLSTLARSSIPSPLKSARTVPAGLLPPVKELADVSAPLLLPKKTEVFGALVATIMVG